MTANFRTSRRLRFEDTEENYVTLNAPKSFGPFEKWAKAV